MKFNLNEFLMAVSFALDFVEIDLLGVSSNHSKRVAYIAYELAEVLGLTSGQKHDVVALSILHDNGASEKVLHDTLRDRQKDNINILESKKEHCTIGEENIKNYPFFTDVSNVIKYHHEKYNGKGFYNKSGKDVPYLSYIIGFADTLELTFDLKNTTINTQKDITEFVKKQKNKEYPGDIIDAFLKVSRKKSFWMNLKDEFLALTLKNNIPEYTMDISYRKVRKITKIMSKIIDAKSSYTQRHSQGLAIKVGAMADYYEVDSTKKIKLQIAADLHDIGKLAIPNSILDSSRKLNNSEYETIKEHVYYTRIVLSEIEGFDDITEWASNHHERLDGSGYPNCLVESQLDFYSKLMACLDVYQALREKRPYRKQLSHKQAMEILYNMRDKEMLEGKIVSDIEDVFSSYGYMTG